MAEDVAKRRRRAEEALRKTGIDIAGKAPWGAHFCQFYDTKQDLIDLLVPYFKAGLESNEYCMWVTCDPLDEDAAAAALAQAVPDLDQYLARRQIEILDQRQWYTKGGRFHPDKVLQRWVDKEGAALDAGYNGLRLTANTLWLEKHDWRSFAEYEAVVNSVIGQHRMIALCSYPLDRCGPREFIDVLRSHQSAVIRREGAWELIESAQLKQTRQALHDISEQMRASEERRLLTARLLEMQEEERRQVAYDIHDGLGGMLTAASMHLETFAAQRQEAGSKEGEVEFDKAKRCLGDAVVEMRRMVSELGPLLLEEVGLVEASRRLLADLAQRQSWDTEFEDDVDIERLDPMAETALFRIVQEALANAAKHSQTRKVRIGFRREAEILLMEVRDWGKGFDVNRVLAQRGPRLHVGLLGMRERATLIGGELRIESAPGKGTKIAVSTPVVSPEAPVIGRKKVEVVDMTEARKGREPARGGITVLIADDHPMVREGLRSMLDADGIDIVGEATNGNEAVAAVQQLNPDIVLMDVRMPDMDGLTATEIVKEGSPETSVIVITSYESKDYLRRAIEVGAAGYLLKGMPRESLIDAIRLVRGGGSLIDARLLSELLREMGVEGSRFRGEEGALEALTPREQEVLQLLVRGLTNKEIAAEMHYSVGTVKNVVQRVIEKLGVSDRTQAAVYAVRAGLNAPP